MKKFKFKFSVSAIILLILAIAVISVAFIWSVISITNGDKDILTIISSSIVILLCICLYIFTVSIIVNSYYGIDNNFLTVNLGLYKQKIPVTEFKGLYIIKQYNGKSYLALYYENEKQEITPVKIVIKRNLYDNFTKEMLDVNVFILTGNREEDENGTLK